jgi:hypothetical protein
VREEEEEEEKKKKYVTNCIFIDIFEVLTSVPVKSTSGT